MRPEGAVGGHAAWCFFKTHGLGDFRELLGTEQQYLPLTHSSAVAAGTKIARQEIMESLRSMRYSGVFMSPPCGTFSPARCVPGGPGPIRGKEAPRIEARRQAGGELRLRRASAEAHVLVGGAASAVALAGEGWG